ncbi:hypothetical protein L226DRAFT_312710 [Lentinus tigrinus ALCF2SS1-7]|uniref:uncharacterized protein n=1 Tax=Lentinus tigrinus ALCF2SS1-7 TaxID=1328758 RepID=UPI001165CDFB|nr:hypothetical protein L226DRAFT_312710 [Lentinus tigrinus ALCF2SS1-7]
MGRSGVQIQESGMGSEARARGGRKDGRGGSVGVASHWQRAMAHEILRSRTRGRRRSRVRMDQTGGENSAREPERGRRGDGCEWNNLAKAGRRVRAQDAARGHGHGHGHGSLASGSPAVCAPERDSSSDASFDFSLRKCVLAVTTCTEALLQAVRPPWPQQTAREQHKHKQSGGGGRGDSELPSRESCIDGC